ncbi:hypothetical protein L210DRAFT_3654825 [Boletus edulis BED1]|uniref:Uncharacterized protein n=1 Tax=Boletus edulis BED1 TaxID=1328754 RepID=A0AAD4BDK5_BOLED|nr:hypothetical protein L210DRAFT_3654825 [Boletus edulis BED1]
MSSGSFSTVDSDSWADKYFPGSSDEIWQDFHHLRPIFVTSPEQPLTALPDSDPSFIFAQCLPIYSSTHKAPPSPNSRALFYFHGRPHQTDNQSNQYYTHFGPVPTTPQSYTTLNVGSSLQGYSSSVVNNPFSVYDTLDYSQDHSTYAYSHYNGSQAVVQSPSNVPPYLPIQPTVSRSPPAQVPPTHRNSQGDHSITGSPYAPIRTSSLPVQSTLPQEVVMDTCKWMKVDGTVCEAQIASATVPEHLATHGIKKMTGNFRLECRWLECRLRGDRKEMKRESIVRHVREKHLRRKRTL